MWECHYHLRNNKHTNSQNNKCTRINTMDVGVCVEKGRETMAEGMEANITIFNLYGVPPVANMGILYVK